MLAVLHEQHRRVYLGFSGALQHRQTEKLLTYIGLAAAFDKDVERTIGGLLARSDWIFAVIHKKSGARWERSRAELRV